MKNVDSTCRQANRNLSSLAIPDNANQATEGQLASGQSVKTTETENNRIPVGNEKRPNIFKRLVDRVIEAVRYVWNKFISLFSSEESRGGSLNNRGNILSPSDDDKINSLDLTNSDPPSTSSLSSLSVCQEDSCNTDETLTSQQRTQLSDGATANGDEQADTYDTGAVTVLPSTSSLSSPSVYQEDSCDTDKTLINQQSTESTDGATANGAKQADTDDGGEIMGFFKPTR